MSKTIFITGASTGLGKAAALLFASKGWKVLATMRTPENEKEFGAIEGITVLPLDVTDPVQIIKIAKYAIGLGPVDVVFNNAGYGLFGPLEAISDEQLVKQLNTNLLGVLRVTQAFIPHFREKKSGLFITTTSIGGLMTYPLCSVYHATKWALEGWSESMAFELGQLGIGIKTVAPGGIKTDFTSRSMQLATDPNYMDQIKKMSDMFMNNPARLDNYSTPEEIAAVVYEAATDGKDKLRYVAGAAAQASYARRLQAGDEAFRKGVEKMWLES